jgi:AhpD family alkylhydroperoxidase
MPRRIAYVTAVSPGSARDLVAQVYAQMRADFGRVVEPVSVRSPSPVVLAGQVPRGVKEAVASAVSATNDCPWCVDVHTMLVRATGPTAAAAVVVLVCTDVTSLRRLSGLAPPLAAILAALGWSNTDRYLNVHT